MVTSQGTTAGNVNRPPGIAVNVDEVVLTTLPFAAGAGFVDGLVRFQADFTENLTEPAGFPQFTLQNDLPDFASVGMSTDEAGNFYVATGVIGTSACGAGGSGALVFIPRTLDDFTCTPSQVTFARSEDTAVSPTNNVPTNNRVVPQ